jgi:hypothetical protein
MFQVTTCEEAKKTRRMKIIIITCAKRVKVVAVALLNIVLLFIAGWSGADGDG